MASRNNILYSMKSKIGIFVLILDNYLHVEANQGV
jgi:hypothetical protein